MKNFFRRIFKWCIHIIPRPVQSRVLCALLEESFFFRVNRAGVKAWFNTAWILRSLRDKGFSPQTIIDCGAYVGDWTRTAKDIFTGSRVLMIEANPEREKDLQRVQDQYPGMTDYALSLLGAEARSAVPFYKMKNGSSVFPEQSNVARTVISLPMKTLDEIASEKGIDTADFIKLDVQGYELEVLKGAARLLKKTECVLLEVSFLEYNKGAPQFDHVISFMRERGFVIYDIGELVRWTLDNTLIQADLIFVREGSALRFNYFNFNTARRST